MLTLTFVVSVSYQTTADLECMTIIIVLTRSHQMFIGGRVVFHTPELVYHVKSSYGHPFTASRDEIGASLAVTGSLTDRAQCEHAHVLSCTKHHQQFPPLPLPFSPPHPPNCHIPQGAWHWLSCSVAFTPCGVAKDAHMS